MDFGVSAAEAELRAAHHRLAKHQNAELREALQQSKAENAELRRALQQSEAQRRKLLVRIAHADSQRGLTMLPFAAMPYDKRLRLREMGLEAFPNIPQGASGDILSDTLDCASEMAHADQTMRGVRRAVSFFKAVSATMQHGNAATSELRTIYTGWQVYFAGIEGPAGQAVMRPDSGSQESYANASSATRQANEGGAICERQYTRVGWALGSVKVVYRIRLGHDGPTVAELVPTHGWVFPSGSSAAGQELAPVYFGGETILWAVLGADTLDLLNK
jgi:hypothetical protein